MELNETQLCQKIRWLREWRGLTQQYMAIELDLSTRAYSKIELGETKLSVRRLYQIADILEVTVHELLILDRKEFLRMQWRETTKNVNESSREEILELKMLLERLLRADQT
jgi:transcriptional regulator with XRE-family HTH domain